MMHPITTTTTTTLNILLLLTTTTTTTTIINSTATLIMCVMQRNESLGTYRTSSYLSYHASLEKN